MIFDESALEKRVLSLSSEDRGLFAQRTAERLISASGSTLTFQEIAKTVPDDADDDLFAIATYALRSVNKEDNVQDVIYTARRAYELADSQAQESLQSNFNSADAEEQLAGHPLVQEELAAQDTALKELENK